MYICHHPAVLSFADKQTCNIIIDILLWLGLRFHYNYDYDYVDCDYDYSRRGDIKR